MSGPAGNGGSAMTRSLLAILSLLGAFVVAAPNAEAQLAKRGTYTSHFASHYVTKVTEIDKDHVFVTGEVIGTLLNEAGQGFLHPAAVVCPFASDNVKGVSNSHGYCNV